MDAIVLAGGSPQSEEPLYTYSKGHPKALIDVAGKPMVQWVLDALGDAKNVDNVIVVGLTSKSGLHCKKPLHYLSNQGKMVSNITSGVEKSLELNHKNRYVLLVSSDIPAVRANMIDWLIQKCMETQDDVYYGVAPREVMDKRYPNSKRTFLHLKDMEVCQADMHIMDVRMVNQDPDTWETLIERRKNPVSLAAAIGPVTAFLVQTRQATLSDLVARVSERKGIKGRAIVWPYAEPCMDVDKPNQLEMMRADLARSSRKSKPAPRKKAKASNKPKPRPATKRKPARRANARPVRKVVGKSRRKTRKK